MRAVASCDEGKYLTQSKPATPRKIDKYYAMKSLTHSYLLPVPFTPSEDSFTILAAHQLVDFFPV